MLWVRFQSEALNQEKKLGHNVP
jgi:hypothetical protein